jgi:hypothetical protein
MDFWFQFLNIHMNEKIIICHEYHDFKQQNIIIYLILTIFPCNPMPFLTCWMVTAPMWCHFNNMLIIVNYAL